MPEIISLLSSPPANLSPAPIAPPRRHPSRSAAPASTSLRYDVFDLTADSPTPSPEKDRGLHPQRSPASKRLREQAKHAHNELFYDSDDFNTTGELNRSQEDGTTDYHGNVLTASTGNHKRLRLSPPEGGVKRPYQRSQSATGSLTNRPPVCQPKQLRREQAVADPIEFSSSPHAPTLKTNITNSRTWGSDDPFASSPAPLAPKPTTKGIAIPEDSNPFSSSPHNPPEDDSRPRTVSAKELSNALSRPKAQSPKRNAGWDPISSSAPELRSQSDPFDSPPKKNTGNAAQVVELSDSEVSAVEESDDEFPDLDNFRAWKKKVKPASSLSTSRTVSKASSKASKHAISKTAPKTAEQKAREKEQREQEKERKQREKEETKAQKARDKERAAAMAEVNKVRTDKKISTPEMIVDIPAGLSTTVAIQIQTLLKDLDVQHNIYTGPLDHVVKWRRKVRSRFNDELGLWEPIPERIQEERYALVIVTADEFVNFALSCDGADLETHVAKMKQHFAEHQLIYLIEGLGPWMRKNRNVRNRQFVSAVRNQADPSDSIPTSSQPVRRRKNQQPQEYIDEDSVEDALLQLQVMHSVLIHHTNVGVETAQWVAVFTQHISTVPYRKQREEANAAGAGFCMESGQVRTGEDAKDTFARMLQEIVRVTAPIAYGISSEFGTVSELVNGLEAGGPLTLEGCRKSANKDGAVSDRTIGQAISRRMHKVFTGRDETSTDV